MGRTVMINNLEKKQNEDKKEAKMKMKNFCFPDNFSTSSGPSVHSYLRNIYDECPSSSSLASSHLNINTTKEVGSNRNNYSISLSTMDPEERRNLIDHLNEFSFDFFQKDFNNDIGSSYKLGPKETGQVGAHTSNDQQESFCSRLSHSDLNGNKNQFKKISSFIDSYNINTPLRRNSVLPVSVPINPNRRFSHKKTNAISLSKEFAMKVNTACSSTNNDTGITFNENKTNNNSQRPRFERFNDIYIGDDDTCTDVTFPSTNPLSYTHHLSPIKIINNTREQIERNQRGTFKTLNDFAIFNDIDVVGKDFVGRPCTPKIDLENKIFPHSE